MKAKYVPKCLILNDPKTIKIDMQQHVINNNRYYFQLSRQKYDTHRRLKNYFTFISHVINYSAN